MEWVGFEPKEVSRLFYHGFRSHPFHVCLQLCYCRYCNCPVRLSKMFKCIYENFCNVCSFNLVRTPQCKGSDIVWMIASVAWWWKCFFLFWVTLPQWETADVLKKKNEKLPVIVLENLACKLNIKIQSISINSWLYCTCLGVKIWILRRVQHTTTSHHNQVCYYFKWNIIYLTTK